VPIGIGGGPVDPIWYEFLKFIENLQPLDDIDNSTIEDLIDTKSDITRTIRPVSGTTDTLVLADAGNVIDTSNSSAVTITVPPNSSVAFPTGTQIEVMQGGAGQVTLAQGSGVTINSKGSNKKISARYVGVTLLKTDTDTWRLMGDLSA
jgi:hypothetical protein